MDDIGRFPGSRIEDVVPKAPSRTEKYKRIVGCLLQGNEITINASEWYLMLKFIPPSCDYKLSIDGDQITIGLEA